MGKTKLALRAEMKMLRTTPFCENSDVDRSTKGYTYSSNVLIRNYFYVLHVSSGLEDLAQNILSDPRVQSSHIQSSLIGFRRRTSDKAT